MSTVDIAEEIGNDAARDVVVTDDDVGTLLSKKRR
jgi:hypothetical protein